MLNPPLGVLEWEYYSPCNLDGVPLVVVQRSGTTVFDDNRSVSQIQDVVDVTIDQLHRNKVVPFASIEHYQTCFGKKIGTNDTF